MKQSIGSNALKLTTSKIITMSISMITAMLLSRFRTLEEYGTYSQLLLVINLFTTIFMLGLPNSINFFLARAENVEEKQKFISAYYTLTTILSFITGLILILSTPIIISYFDNILIKNFMYVFAVFPWANIVLSSIDNLYIVYQKTTRLMIFRISNVTFLLLAILIVQVFSWDFNTYLIIFIVGEAAFALLVYFIARNLAGNIKILFDKELFKKIFKFSIPIGLASVVGILSIESDKLMIGRFFNTEQLAIYTNAAKEMPVTIVASSLTAVLMPHLVTLFKKNKVKEAIGLWGDTISLSYIIICFLAVGIFIYAPEVMTFLYSDKYISGVPVFRVYSLVLLFRCTYFGMILNSIGKTKVILHSSIIALILNVVFCFVFYYTFGFIGPAIATLVATLLSATYILFMTSKTINISFKDIFPWRNILLITIVNIIFATIFAVIKKLLPLEQSLGEVFESIILGLIWAICYFTLSFRFIETKWKILNEDDKT